MELVAICAEKPSVNLKLSGYFFKDIHYVILLSSVLTFSAAYQMNMPVFGSKTGSGRWKTIDKIIEAVSRETVDEKKTCLKLHLGDDQLYPEWLVLKKKHINHDDN